MDNKKIFEAAFTGNVELLQKLLQENPFILTDFQLKSPTESLIHVAVKTGQQNFVRELIKHQPGLSSQLDKDGLRPMDIASITGNVEIVKELIKINGNVCRMRGKDQRTALHYAAMNGRVEVIDELISTCPECIKDVTIRDETALHLAVQNNQFEAFSVLVKWLERLGLEVVVNFGDCDGNTVLHLAASRKQHETIELLVSKNKGISTILQVNAINSKGLTAMDILDIVIENPNDLKLREIIRRAREHGAQGLSVISSPPSFQQVQWTIKTHHENQSQNFKDWFKYFKFQLTRDSPSDTRNALLVVAALIATVTFQAGVNPPNGLVDVTTTTQSNSGNRTLIGPATSSGLAVASAILGSRAKSYLFLFANTLGLTASLSIIIYLTGGFPFQRELLISIYSMMFSYGFSISGITEEEGITYVLLGIAFVLPFSIRWLPRWGSKVWKWWRKHSTKQVL